MSWVDPTLANFAIDKAATSQDILEVINGLIALKKFPKRIPFGGDPTYLYANTSYQSLIHPIYNEIDGTDLGGLTFELHFMALILGGQTVTVQLWNRGDSLSVVEKTVTTGSLALQKSTSFSLATSLEEYEVRVKSSGTAGFRVYGANLVQI